MRDRPARYKREAKLTKKRRRYPNKDRRVVLRERKSGRLIGIYFFSIAISLRLSGENNFIVFAFQLRKRFVGSVFSYRVPFAIEFFIEKMATKRAFNFLYAFRGNPRRGSLICCARCMSKRNVKIGRSQRIDTITRFVRRSIRSPIYRRRQCNNRSSFGNLRTLHIIPEWIRCIVYAQCHRYSMRMIFVLRHNDFFNSVSYPFYGRSIN